MGSWSHRFLFQEHPKRDPLFISMTQSRLFQAWIMPILLQHSYFPMKTLYSWSWLPPLGLNVLPQSMKPAPHRQKAFSVILSLPSPQEIPQNLCSSISRRPNQRSRHRRIHDLGLFALGSVVTVRASDKFLENYQLPFSECQQKPETVIWLICAQWPSSS